MTMTIEQKIIQDLAKQGILTKVWDVYEALKDSEYANKLITGNGLKDEIEEAGDGCKHESLTNDEIQEVFDNDDNQ
jgi:hypothetical protein